MKLRKVCSKKDQKALPTGKFKLKQQQPKFTKSEIDLMIWVSLRQIFMLAPHLLRKLMRILTGKSSTRSTR